MTATKNTTALSPEQKREARAAAERDRRDRIRRINAACEAADLAERYEQLTKEQRERAAETNDLGRAEGAETVDAAYILTGEVGVLDEPVPAEAEPEPVAEPTAEERYAALQERGRERGFDAKEQKELERLRSEINGTSDARTTTDRLGPPRRGRDEEALAFAAQASALSDQVRSGWTTTQARLFLNRYRTETNQAGDVDVTRIGDGKTVTFAAETLRAFGVRGEKDPAVRKAIIALTDDTGRRLWGRQFALYVLARIAA